MVNVSVGITMYFKYLEIRANSRTNAAAAIATSHKSVAVSANRRERSVRPVKQYLIAECRSYSRGRQPSIHTDCNVSLVCRIVALAPSKIISLRTDHQKKIRLGVSPVRQKHE